LQSGVKNAKAFVDEVKTASKIARNAKYLKYAKRLGWVGAAITVATSYYEISSAYKTGGSRQAAATGGNIAGHLAAASAGAAAGAALGVVFFGVGAIPGAIIGAAAGAAADWRFGNEAGEAAQSLAVAVHDKVNPGYKPPASVPSPVNAQLNQPQQQPIASQANRHDPFLRPATDSNAPAQLPAGQPMPPAPTDSLAIISVDYSWGAASNFGDHADLAQRTEDFTRVAKDKYGTAYADYTDVKNAATDSEKNVRILQHYLKDHGHPELAVDGLMGKLTRAAFLKNSGINDSAEDGFSQQQLATAHQNFDSTFTSESISAVQVVAATPNPIPYAATYSGYDSLRSIATELPAQSNQHRTFASDTNSTGATIASLRHVHLGDPQGATNLAQGVTNLTQPAKNIPPKETLATRKLAASFAV
jgi:hypothetical protein